MANRPAGYSLTIESWENDADYYKTIVLDGLKSGDVVFYIHLLQHFKPNSYRRDYFGGSEYDPKIEVDLIEKTFNLYPPESKELKETITEIITEYRDSPDFVDELLGGRCGEGYFWRTFESYEIHNIPKECVDVTDHFRLNFEHSKVNLQSNEP